MYILKDTQIDNTCTTHQCITNIYSETTVSIHCTLINITDSVKKNNLPWERMSNITKKFEWYKRDCVKESVGEIGGWER